MTNYCKNCGIKVQRPNPLLNLVMVQPKIYEFEDGVYCEKCAKMRVDKRRKRI